LLLDLKKLQDKPVDVIARDIDGDGRCDVMIIRPFGPMTLIRQVRLGEFEIAPDDAGQTGFVSDLKPSDISVVPLGPQGRPALLVTRQQFARSLIFEPGKGWAIVDQYQAPEDRSRLIAAGAFQTQAGASPTIATFDSVTGKLLLMVRKEGAYRVDREVKVGQMAAKKLLAGNFGGPSPVSLLVCGGEDLALVPIMSEARELRRLAAYESKTKDARLGFIACGDLNGKGKVPDLVLLDHARHVVEVVAFDADGQLTSGTRFQVFEEHRGADYSAFQNRDAGPGEPRWAGIADVTGRGKADLVLQVHDRIIIYPQD
jgi:hypothetical protein